MAKNSKAFGWFLLLFGLGIILWTFYSSYNIFTGRVPVPEIFEVRKAEKGTEGTLPAQKADSPQAQMEQILQGQLKEALPTDILPQLLNLIAWSIFAGIMTFGGAQVAGLGIKMIK